MDLDIAETIKMICLAVSNICAVYMLFQKDKNKPK
jgi:hypothetical protein